MEKDNSAENLHRKHEELTETIYRTPGMLPNRYVYILTTKCNLKCGFCFLDKHSITDPMTNEDWNHLSNQLPDYARVTLTGGEPLLFDGFKDVFSNVASRYDCNLITNGTLLDEKTSDYILSFPNFHLLSISVDDVGNRIRGVNPNVWAKTEERIKYFLNARNQLKRDCGFDIKTTILDETAEELFNIHRYCVEKLGCDYHVFHFLKGSEIQHSDRMFSIDDCFESKPAATYKKMDEIQRQLTLIREYNLLTGSRSFLHPKVGSLMEGDMDNLCLANTELHNPENFESCKYPWSSVHINTDGNVIPCLAVPVGNVKKERLIEIVNGERMQSFRKIIKDNGTIPGCNRCGWIKPAKVK